MAQTIDEVLKELDTIIAQCAEDNSALGFFTVLYRKVTARIKDGILQSEFEDNSRMEKLDVIFANRYIEAYKQYKTGKTPTKSWQIAFNASKDKDKLILQHLLLGINAHINLDLGIAASETVVGSNLDSLKVDFDNINKILSELVEEVESKIASVSPLFKLLDFIAGKLDEKLVSFSINIARDGAWKFALEYHHSDNQQESIDIRDSKIATLGKEVSQPKLRLLKISLFVIKLFESKNNKKIMKALS